MSIIVVENLNKQYAEVQAIKNICFEVKKGEIFGILGPNGAGKTTILEILETLRKKTSGKIIINGYDIDIYPQAIKQTIGVQLQASGYYPHLNLKELINLFAGLYNISVDVHALLSSVQLQDKVKYKYKHLSGGQQQRFALATTLINQPDIIFLDEPSTGLDPQARRQLWENIKNLKQQDKTIVLSTHYMDEAEELCDRIAILNHGELLALDTPDNMIDELIAKGFEKSKLSKKANLEDVYIHKLATKRQVSC